MFSPSGNNEFRVFCDKRHLKGIKHKEFCETLVESVSPHLPRNSLIRIEMIDSTHDANIQIADWISGALAHYLEGKKFGTLYYSILKDNLLNPGKELFNKKIKP